MSFESKEAALEFATELALEGKIPSTEEALAIRAAGVNYQDIYNILSEVFYNGQELGDAESE
ncbi:MAG: hypothetical protein [Bacteriophage sp.]|nr:MAG: hypothetical protein [Bacteriophage sp.]